MNASDLASAERREATRFSVTLEMTFEGGNGLTRDVSAAGVFFNTASLFGVGDQIRFTLALDHAYPGVRQEVACEGVVVRVERAVEAHGVAVRIHRADIGLVDSTPQ